MTSQTCDLLIRTLIITPPCPHAEVKCRTYTASLWLLRATVS